MVEKLYFTPAAEDLAAGYECQVRRQINTVRNIGLIPALREATRKRFMDIWENIVIAANIPEKRDYEFTSMDWFEETLDEYMNPSFTVHDVELLLQDSMVRVPYLNIEDIVKDGWQLHCIGSNNLVGSFFYPNNEKPKFKLYLKKNQLISIDKRISQGNDLTVFIGRCQDINTLRKIMKLL